MQQFCFSLRHFRNCCKWHCCYFCHPQNLQFVIWMKCYELRIWNKYCTLYLGSNPDLSVICLLHVLALLGLLSLRHSNYTLIEFNFYILIFILLYCLYCMCVKWFADMYCIVCLFTPLCDYLKLLDKGSWRTEMCRK